jgi:putative ABC transport system substrate-binding protein
MPVGQTNRRAFIAGLGGTAAWPLAVRAQQAGTPVIGFMSSRSPEDSVHLLAAFRQGLGETGFIEGQNVAIEFRWAQGQYQRLSALAADLVSRWVAVFTAVGGETSALAAKQATSTIPIMFVSTDPVRSGLVESYNQPGGNATGSFLATAEMEPKRLGLLHELAPGVSPCGRSSMPSRRDFCTRRGRAYWRASCDSRAVLRRIVLGITATRLGWEKAVSVGKSFLWGLS